MVGAKSSRNRDANLCAGSGLHDPFHDQARGVPKENFPGVQGIMNDTKTRSRLIARTETMRSQNMTTTKLYQQQGFNYVQASDIDGGVDNYVDPADGLTCSQRNGQVFRTSEAYDVMDHPNGTLTWIPMPMSYKE